MELDLLTGWSQWGSTLGVVAGLIPYQSHCEKFSLLGLAWEPEKQTMNCKMMKSGRIWGPELASQGTGNSPLERDLKLFFQQTPWATVHIQAGSAVWD